MLSFLPFNVFYVSAFWQMSSRVGTASRGSENALPGWELIFYAQKTVSRIGNTFFTLRKALPSRERTSGTCFLLFFGCQMGVVPYFLFNLLRPMSMRSMMKSRMVKPHNEEPP